jgi:membrane-associated phospholipid phosphatase
LKPWLLALTDFGDAAVLIPLAAAMLVWLLFGASRAAAWWVVSLGFCLGLTALLKVYFFACPPAPDLRSPSGHTAFSILVYGAIALVTAVQGEGCRRGLAIAAGAGLVIAISASRLLLGVHSLPEIGFGLVIGTLSLSVFGWSYPRHRPARLWPLLVGAGVLMTILHGQELRAEEFLHRITGYLQVRCG